MNGTRLDQQEARRGIERDGYFLLRDVVSKEKLALLDAEIKQEYERQVREGELFGGGGTIAGHLNCFPGEGSRFVIDDLETHGVLDLIAAFAPEAVGRLRVNCNVNLPGSAKQHYHIDGYYSTPFYACTVAVIDTDLTNGALDVLPGTHQRYYKFWQYALTRQYRSTTRVPMRQGDVLVRKSTAWHRAMPNRSDALRAQLTFTFGEGAAPEGDPFMLSDGRIYFEPNWYGTSRLSKVREQISVKAPLTYSSYRFVRSLVGRKGYAPEKRFGDFSGPPARRFQPSWWPTAGR